MIELVKIIFNTYKQNPTILALTIITIILGILSKKYYPKFRGFMGEFWLSRELNKLPKKEYIILNDIMIESDNNTYQIDHIVISKYGIFVIEMKNYYGYIYGSNFKEQWIQKIGKIKRKFYNPVFQNYGHVKALSKVLNLEENIFIPIVCFSNQVKLNIKGNSNVTTLNQINKTIKSNTKIILENDIYILKEKILSLNITDDLIRKRHVKIIEEKIKSKNNRKVKQNESEFIKRIKNNNN